MYAKWKDKILINAGDSEILHLLQNMCKNETDQQLLHLNQGKK